MEGTTLFEGGISPLLFKILSKSEIPITERFHNSATKTRNSLQMTTRVRLLFEQLRSFEFYNFKTSCTFHSLREPIQESCMSKNVLPVLLSGSVVIGTKIK